MSGTTFELINSIRVLEKDSIIKASAGTGKTQSLQERTAKYALDFLNENQRLPKIIISTFTRKATEELKVRITDEVLKKDPSIHALVQSHQYLHISTIHGVLSLFLRKYGHLFGLESGFKVVDAEQSSEFFEGLLQDYLSRDAVQKKHENLLSRFGFSQIMEALDKLYEIKFIHASAKMAGPEDQKQAIDSFIQQSVREAKSRLEDIQIAASTDESWADYISSLSELLKHLRLTEASKISQFIQQIENLNRPRFNAKKLDFSKEISDAQMASVKGLQSTLEKCQKWIEFLPEFQKNSQDFELLSEEFLPLLLEKKKSRGILDSRDLEIFSLMCLRQEPALGYDFASDWDFWMIDEFQDTSPLQIDLIDLLRGDSPVQYVGDPQQSIYLFRGARVEVFTNVLEKVEQSNGPQHQLLTNYRSRPELLSAINDLLTHMGPEFQHMNPRAEIENKEHVSITAAMEAEDSPEYASVLSHIGKLVDSGVAFSDICILARRKSELLKLNQVLQQSGAPTNLHLSVGFYARREILDFLALLKFLFNPHDDENLFVLLRSPFFHLADETLLKFSERKSSLWVYLGENESQNPIFQSLNSIYQLSRSQGAYQTLLQFFTESKMFAASLHLDPSLRREANIWKLLLSLREQERLPGFQYLDFLRKAEMALFDDMNDEANATAVGEANRINLMTIHGSKGLKFKHVIIPHMESAPRFSSSRAHESVVAFDESKKIWSAFVIEASEQKRIHSPALMHALNLLNQREEDELKRLFYVAITRAQETLFLHAKAPGKSGYSSKSWASMFPFWFQAGRTQNNTHIFNVDHGPWELKQFTSDNQKRKSMRPEYQISQQLPSLQRFSVSSLLETEADIQTDSLKGIEQRKKFLYAPGFGTKIHNLFESIKYFGAENVLQKIKSDAQMTEAIRWSTQLKHPPLLDIIKNGHVEWGFQVQTPKGILEGQIDLWGTVDGVTWLIDYKSGSMKNSQKAFDQLKYYAYALGKITGLKSFQLLVLYPMEKQFKEQPFDLSSFEFKIAGA